MKSIPLFEALSSSQRILLAGAGGGFDIFCGLPLYFALKEQGKHVSLANLSFTTLEHTTGRRLSPACLVASHSSSGSDYYFPERYLCQWFFERGEEVEIYCLSRTGYQPLAAAYQAIQQEVKADAIVLVDGGTDSLMRGDEEGLGTPEEDALSLALVQALDVPQKLLVCLGFGVDAFHGVCHAHFLESVSALIQEGAFLGAFSLLKEMPEAKRYQEACQFVYQKMPTYPSIVSSSVGAALEGFYGDHHSTERTKGSRLWINPLMSLYWCFRLEAVAKRNLYLEALKPTQTRGDVVAALHHFRKNLPSFRAPMTMPV